jgi:hypothetical protein
MRQRPSSTDADTEYRVFFSHASRDAPVAKSIIEIIARNTENLECYLSESIEKGSDWRSAIAERLTLSSILILIFTEPDEDWAWALYEAGFFDSLSQTTHSRRIFCLHPSSVTPPSPLAHLQSVPARIRDVTSWLAELFSYSKQKRRCWDAIPTIAAQICQLFSVERKQRYSILVPMLTIFLKDEIAISSDLALSARIEADNYALKLLSLQEGMWTLEDVKRAQSDRQWFNELIGNVVTVANGQHTVPAKHLLHTSHGDFIPTISRLAREKNTELTLTVELVELPKEGRTEAFFGRPISSKSWPEVFVAMPFLTEIDPIYRDHIKEIVEKKMKKSLGRADDFYTNHEIMKDVWSAIYYSDAVIADCTGRNPNVFYEIGIAHTLGKKTVLIAQKIDDIPFDVRHIRSIIYEYTPRGVKEFEKKLEDTLRALFDPSSK